MLYSENLNRTHQEKSRYRWKYNISGPGIVFKKCCKVNISSEACIFFVVVVS
jgi:hypothetical protein